MSPVTIYCETYYKMFIKWNECNVFVPAAPATNSEQERADANAIKTKLTTFCGCYFLNWSKLRMPLLIQNIIIISTFKINHFKNHIAIDIQQNWLPATRDYIFHKIIRKVLVKAWTKTPLSIELICGDREETEREDHCLCLERWERMPRGCQVSSLTSVTRKSSYNLYKIWRKKLEDLQLGLLHVCIRLNVEIDCLDNFTP